MKKLSLIKKSDKRKTDLYKSLIAVFILVASLSISNNAAAALNVSIDFQSVFFDRIGLGETKELFDFGDYHNEVTCNSTNGRTWYLKMHLLRPLSFDRFSIPVENFQWQVVYSDGTGDLMNPHRYTPFSLIPNLIYMSGSGESSGTDVRIQFKYRLTIPEIQRAGTYNTIIRYTLTEML